MTDQGVHLVSLFNEIPTDVEVDGFSDYWKVFPTSDAYPPYFPSTRPVRTRQIETKQLFGQLVDRYGAGALTQAAQAYKDSMIRQYNGKHSPFKFMKGPFKFLESGEFLNHINNAPELLDDVL